MTQAVDFDANFFPTTQFLQVSRALSVPLKVVLIEYIPNEQSVHSVEAAVEVLPASQVVHLFLPVKAVLVKLAASNSIPAGQS